MELGYKMFNKLLIGVFLSALIALAILLQTTTPGTIGPVGILLVFISLYIAVLCVLTFLLILINRVYIKATGVISTGHPARKLTSVRAYYFSSVLALGPLMVIGMQSVGRVGVYEL